MPQAHGAAGCCAGCGRGGARTGGDAGYFVARAERSFLFAAAFNTGPGAKGFFKHSAELVEGSSDRLFSSGTTEKEALDRLRYVGPGIHRWTRRLVKHPAQPGMANFGGAPGAAAGPGVECRVLASGAHRSDGMVAVTKMVEAEETVWAPTLGLRGVIDAVAVGKLDEIGKDGKKWYQAVWSP